MVSAAVLGEIGENLGGEVGVGLTQAKVVMEVLEVTEDGFGRVGEGDIERELKDSTDSGNAADDVRAINGTGVPSVSSGLGDGGKHVGGWGCAVFAGDGDSFVEGAEESFDRKAFVIAFCERVEAKAEGFAHSLEAAAKFAISVADDEATETHFEKDCLHEQFGERSRIGFASVVTDDKAGEVTHGGKEVCGSFNPRMLCGFDGAGLPEVDVNDEERRGDGPGEVQFTATMDRGFGG